MKKNILKNVQLDKREKIFRDFRKLNAKGYSCQIVLTTKRLIIYSNKLEKTLGRKAKHKRMSEFDINSINHLEYYIKYLKNSIWVRLIGLLIFAAGLAAGYFFYLGRIPIPAMVPNSVLPYAKYVAAGLIAIIGLTMMFRVKKTLHFIVKTLNSKQELKFEVNKYNEVAIRYIASKIRPN